MNASGRHGHCVYLFILQNRVSNSNRIECGSTSKLSSMWCSFLDLICFSCLDKGRRLIVNARGLVATPLTPKNQFSHEWKIAYSSLWLITHDLHVLLKWQSTLYVTKVGVWEKRGYSKVWTGCLHMYHAWLLWQVPGRRQVIAEGRSIIVGPDRTPNKLSTLGRRKCAKIYFRASVRSMSKFLFRKPQR